MKVDKQMKTKPFQGSAPGLPSRLPKLLSHHRALGQIRVQYELLGLLKRIQQPRQKALGQRGTYNACDEPWFPCGCRSPQSPGAPGGEQDPAPPALSRARVLNRLCPGRDPPGALPAPLLAFHRAGINPQLFSRDYQPFVNPVIKCSQPNTTRMTETY